MIMTFCSYARILEDFFQFDRGWSYTSVAYGRPLTTKKSNVTYLLLTPHQRLLSILKWFMLAAMLRIIPDIILDCFIQSSNVIIVEIDITTAISICG